MRNILNRISIVIALIATLAVPVLTPVTAAADTVQVCKGVQAIGGGACNGTSFTTYLKRIVNILLFVIGAVAVIMIIVGGIRYVVSGGDSSAVTGAKNTILYAVIGLVVAAMAFAIVNFVVGKL